MVPTPEGRARLVPALAALVAVAVAGVGLAIVLREGGRSGEPSPSLVAGALAAALAQARPAEEPFPDLTEVHLGVGDDCLRLVVADEVDERVQGLRGRSDLGSYDGMLFVYDAPADSAFTMAGVPVPLDIGWYAASGRPVDRARMEPCAIDRDDCPLYSARSRYRFALETLGGELPAGGLSACPA